MTATLQLNFVPGQHYACNSCGKCCKSSWNIDVDAKSREIIKDSQVYQEVKKKGYLPLKMADDNKTSMGRKKDGSCSFLGEDSLCGVHAEMGESNKPVACQIFPHILTSTPDGYYVSLSYACPAVAEGLGGEHSQHAANLEKLIGERGWSIPQNAPVAERIPLTEEVSLSWGEYQILEQKIMQAFRPQSPSLSLLSIAEQLLSAAAENKVENILRSGFSVKRAPSESSQQLNAMFTVHAISILELEQEPEKRANFINQLLSSQPESARHGIKLPQFEGSTSTDPVDLALVRTYLENLLLGKRLLDGSLVDKLLKLAVGFSIFLYYSSAFKSSELTRDRANILAIELVESDVLTHSRGLEPLFDELAPAVSQALQAQELAA